MPSAFFEDPDGNGWAIQQGAARAGSRLVPDEWSRPIGVRTAQDSPRPNSGCLVPSGRCHPGPAFLKAYLRSSRSSRTIEGNTMWPSCRPSASGRERWTAV